ncbi:MAG TPA: SPOR domain-containing protein [Terracidiphilus sp.]|nr:SPOR domain-containing protein [Terracidiphilus sp.]
MRRGFDGEELETDEGPAARELTLGPVALLVLLSVLALVCFLCFGLGYAAGRRVPLPAVPATQAGTQAQPQANALSKPMAAGVVPPVMPPAVVADMPQSQTVSNGGENPLTSYAPAGAANGETDNGAVAGQPSLVKPALLESQNAAQQQGGLQVQPALEPSAGLMVQIAAVSHAGDANVLMNALRRRGYAVTARHEAADSLIHVQIGPFPTVKEANAMCEKLLGDGYNAVVVP